MEPNKFDNIVKEKLEQRTIQPREMAWDRLDAMLSVAEEKAAKPKRKNRTWMYVAASFLGFLLVGTIFLKQGSNNNTDVKSTETQVAVTPERAVRQDNANEAVKTVNSTPVEIKVQEAEVAAATAVSKPVNKPSFKTITRKGETGPGLPEITEEAVAQSNETEIVSKPLSNEAETLLADANIEQAKKPAIKVNANSLLSSVEGELDSSFRNKAMQTLVKNYNSVKTSVANRNHK
jgi:hypothetical protein